MTRKTNITLKFTPDNEMTSTHSVRVKLDSGKFPYIVINNEKHIIASSDFPLVLHDFGGKVGQLECESGLEELKRIISNPDLTVDRLSLKSKYYVAVSKND